MNGVLCSTAPMSQAPPQYLIFPDPIHPPVLSSTIPSVVSGTVVYCRPGLTPFLNVLNRFCHIHVWSTLPPKVVDGLCSFLFSRSDAVPQVVLASNSCDDLLLKNYTSAMYPGTTNPILLKYPRRRLYTRGDANFNADNLIMVDSNPATCMAIPPKNTIFPDPWIHSHPGPPSDCDPLKLIQELCFAVHLRGPQNFSQVMSRRPSQNDLSKDSELYGILSRNLPYVWNQLLVNGKTRP